jgi:GxxExxY protein
MMTENEIAREVVDAAYHIHTKLGPGLFESVYETILVHELNKRGLTAERQVPVTIEYDDITFDEGFRADLIVENKFIVELKSVEKLANVHKKQLLTYLRLTDMKLGLLINFGEELIKNGILRIVNGLKNNNGNNENIINKKNISRKGAKSQREEEL